MQESADSLHARLADLQAELSREVREGHAEILAQARLMHGRLLPELRSLLAQQTLELSCMHGASGGGASGGGGGGVLGWLWGSKAEEEQQVLETRQAVSAALELAGARLEASGAAAEGTMQQVGRRLLVV